MFPNCQRMSASPLFIMFLYLRSKRYWLGGIPGKKTAQPLHKFLKLSFPVTDKNTAELLLSNYRIKELRQNLGVELPDPVPVKSFYLDYSRYCDQNKTKFTVESDTPRLKRWLWFLGENRIEDVAKIGKPELTSFINTLQLANSTKNRYMNFIKASIQWGKDNGYLKENSLIGYRQFTETKPFKPSEITPVDKEKIWAIKDKRFRLFLQVVYYTLARRSEILNLLWSDIDLKKRTITFRVTKTKTVRVIPICDQLYFLLKDQYGDPDKKIFPWKPTTVSFKFSYFRDKEKLSIRGIHEIRHAMASEWLRLHVPLPVVQYFLGHTTAHMTLDRYIHINMTDMFNALKIVGDL